MNNSSQRKIGVILSYVSIILNTIVQLIYTPFLIRNLGQSEYGLFSLVSSIISYLTILDLGFGNAIVVYTAKYREQGLKNEEEKLHGMFKIIFMVIGIVAFIVGLLLLLNIDSLFSKTMTLDELNKLKVMMIILVFNLAITFPFSIYSSIINAYEKFIFQKVLSILNTLAKPLVMIPLLFLGYKSITMCIVITIVNIIVIMSNYIYCRYKLKVKIKFKGFDKKLFKLIFGYSFWVFLGVIVDRINWSVDQFVLGAVSGAVAVSIYSVASQINSLFTNLSTAVSGVMLPKMSKMIAQNVSNEQITKEFIKVGRIQYYIIFLLASGFVLVGKSFIIWWAGIEYVEAYYIALILILPLCIPLIQNLGISIMQAKNMHKFRSILYAIIAIANILISIPLAKMYAGIGSAIGTGVSLLIGNGIIINIYYQKKVGIIVTKFWKEILKMTISFVMPILIILIIIRLSMINGLLGVIIYGGIYTIIYSIVCYCFVMNDYEKSLLIRIKTKIKLGRKVKNETI